VIDVQDNVSRFFAIDHYVLVSFVTIAATGAILAYNSPKTVWRPGGSARTSWGSLSAPPDTQAAKRGLLLRGGEGRHIVNKRELE